MNYLKSVVCFRHGLCYLVEMMLKWKVGRLSGSRPGQIHSAVVLSDVLPVCRLCSEDTLHTHTAASVCLLNGVPFTLRQYVL